MKRRYFIVFLVAALASLLSATYRTVIWAGDAHGLLVLATLTDNEHTFNPWSRNGYFISPDGAAWILRNFDFPYNRCTELTNAIDRCGGSLFGGVSAFLDHPDRKVRNRLYALLDHLIERGEPVNVKDANGMPLVHQAILYGNERLLKVLMEAGADLSARQGPEQDSFDAYAFARFLAARNPEKYEPIVQLLERERKE